MTQAKGLKPIKQRESWNGYSMPEKLDELEPFSKIPLDLARALGCTRQNATILLRGGKIPHIKVGKRFQIRESDIIAFIEKNFHPVTA